jgi:hypothetical protein
LVVGFCLLKRGFCAWAGKPFLFEIRLYLRGIRLNLWTGRVKLYAGRAILRAGLLDLRARQDNPRTGLLNLCASLIIRRGFCFIFYKIFCLHLSNIVLF